MEIKNSNYTYQSVIQMDDEQTSSRKFLANVFAWMFGALLLSALCSYEFFTNKELLSLIVSPTGMTGLGTVIMFSPLGFCFAINLGYTRLSYAPMVILFVAYAVVTGISLSVLGLIYAGSTIATVFLGCAVLYGMFAIAGYTTRTDLTKMGTYLVIGMFGIVIASLLNYFLGSAQLDYLIGIGGVVVFTGLTAYYVQMLKRIGEGTEYGSAEQKKLVIIGAFVLYTNFINLFLSLLRVFGGRRR